MEKLNTKSFIAGSVFSLVIFLLLSFTNAFQFSQNSTDFTTFKEATPQTGSKISSSLAMNYRQNYESLYPGEIKGLNLSVEQWQAINQTVTDMNSDLSKTAGFRLYFGSKSNSRDAKKIAVVYTLNKSLKENNPGAMVNMAEGYDGKFSQQCPPFCD